VNTWGTRDYRYQDEHGEVVVGVAPEDPDEYDFDLGRWISSGRLRWTAPGDPSLALRDSLDGCPYLSLSGRREILTIQEGTVW
jgi:hypothetical protein